MGLIRKGYFDIWGITVLTTEQWSNRQDPYQVKYSHSSTLLHIFGSFVTFVQIFFWQKNAAVPRRSDFKWMRHRKRKERVTVNPRKKNASGNVTGLGVKARTTTKKERKRRKKEKGERDQKKKIKKHREILPCSNTILIQLTDTRITGH